MFVPQAFAIDDPAAVVAFIREYPFGTLISGQDGHMTASHLPFVFDGERGPHGTLTAHMARANPQWESFGTKREHLVIFQGPHGYISPSWYGQRSVVPTWNYTTVHVYGVPRVIGQDRLWDLLEDLVRRNESGFEEPWRLDLPEDYRDRMLAGIVGFEIPLDRVEAKFKLNQNLPAAIPPRVIAALQRSDMAGARDLGAFMAAYYAYGTGSKADPSIEQER